MENEPKHTTFAEFKDEVSKRLRDAEQCGESILAKINSHIKARETAYMILICLLPVIVMDNIFLTNLMNSKRELFQIIQHQNDVIIQQNKVITGQEQSIIRYLPYYEKAELEGSLGNDNRSRSIRSDTGDNCNVP